MVKKIFYNVLLVCIVVFALDFAIGKLLEHYYFKQVAGSAYETNYGIDSTKAEIIILGSSRASHHYVPSVFEDSLGMSCYNIGRNGHFLMYGYAMFLAIANRYHPKIVIFDITPGELDNIENHYDRLSSLLPYYRNHTEIREIIKFRSRFENCKLLSQIYPFNSIITDIITGNFHFKGRREKIINGYIPLSNRLQDTYLQPIVDHVSNLDSNAFKAILSMMEICRQKQIRFIVVTSPIYANILDCKTCELIKFCCIQNQNEYYNYTQDTTFTYNSHFFHDPKHLNDIGARLFSQNLVEKVKTQKH